MAMPPNQDEAMGDVNSVARVAWHDANSLLVAIQSGKQYQAALGLGQADYNFDDAEGWAPRINYHGTSDQEPWNGIGGGGGSIDHVSKTVTSLRRKDQASAGSSKGTSAYVLKMTNTDGAYGNEVYTDNYNGTGTEALICKTLDDQTWYLSWYARKSSTNSSDPVRMTCYIFGMNYDYGSTSYIYNFTGASIGNGSSGTKSNPATGHSTYYIGKKTLTTSWQEFNAAITFNGKSEIQFIVMRWDLDDGVSLGTTTIYIDRPTLHPIDLKYKKSEADTGSDPDSVAAGDEGTYAT